MRMIKTALLVSSLALIGGASAHAGNTALDAAKAPQEAALAYMQSARPALAPEAASPKIQMPPPEAMIIMIRSSLVALSQANVTNNYTVLNQLGSDNFRSTNPPARLAQLFGSFRSNQIDLAPVVFVTPQLSQQPRIADGKLHLVGNFPTAPMRVDFDLRFEPSGGIWKLFGLEVNLNRAAPTAAPQTQFVPGQGAQPQTR